MVCRTSASGDAPRALDPYLDYLQQRWDEGEHSAKILYQELLAKGYLGHYQRVKMAVAPLATGPASGRAARTSTLPARSRALDYYPT